MNEKISKSTKNSKISKGQRIAIGAASGLLALGLIGGGVYLANYHGETTTIVASNDSSNTASTTLVDGKNKITTGGTYTFTGTITGKITVDTTDAVIIILNNVNITGNDGEAIKCQEGSNVTIELVGTNTITSGSEGDGINAEGDLTIKGDGSLTIKADDDGVHADGKLQIDGGNITITAAEGLEATYIIINGGTIKITATDDGINAASKSTAYSVKVEINGGDITIDMGQGDTDAIDSNGDLYINGGTITITGQSPFDYDGTAKLSGGKLIVNGTETTTITNQFMGGGGGGMMSQQQTQQTQQAQQAGGRGIMIR